jgi:septal ring factor EnvC (AmiA/AmiB activator)
MTNWVFIAATLFLLFFLYITWGAWQGYFSPVLPPPATPPELGVLKQEKEQLQTTVAAARDTIFSYENSTAEIQAMNRDLERRIEYLMDQINDLTTKLAAAQDQNRLLRQGLKEALEQLDLLRKQLMQCKTREDARRLTRQYCETTPESNMLY